MTRRFVALTFTVAVFFATVLPIRTNADSYTIQVKDLDGNPIPNTDTVQIEVFQQKDKGDGVPDRVQENLPDVPTFIATGKFIKPATAVNGVVTFSVTLNDLEKGNTNKDLFLVFRRGTAGAAQLPITATVSFVSVNVRKTKVNGIDQEVEREHGAELHDCRPGSLSLSPKSWHPVYPCYYYIYTTPSCPVHRHLWFRKCR